MNKQFDNADVCEEAHKRTVAECKENNIVVDLIEEDGSIYYTPLAQRIFDRHHEEVETEMFFNNR